ncbi:uncharacterized protein LOC119772125 [Cyprinodon tularosa]|uniref:uncharacterized protein LOC119772125 n=1 Tax=Cyprinodon tularosa TaxID=77115 RepID=UPI0018E1DE99|nr:uncharacterized protein LOC119772125 [Cyprinodon tularosa]
MEPLFTFLLLLFKLCELFNFIKTYDIIQETGIRAANAGETVTLPCSCQHNAITYFFWYQQKLGHKPHLISNRMKHSKESIISPAYKDRFQVLSEPEEGLNNLMIIDLKPSDSGTYYCVILAFNTIEFGQGLFLHIKTASSNTQLPIQQSALSPLQLGDSLNLSCSVSAEPCKGEQSLYWLRHTASQPSLMYPSAKNCIGLKNGPLHCTSNLELNSVMSSDAGTYYCALTSCGMVVFGEGTNVEILASSFLVYVLGVAVVISIIGLLFLSFLRNKLKSKLCMSCAGTSKPQCSEALEITENQTENLHYAALNIKRKAEGQQQEDDPVSTCVYSTVKSRKE